jgi:S1/P1 Nuclease
MTNQSGKRAADVAALAAIAALCCVTTPAHAWGDEGHEIVALIAKHYLNPTVAAKVNTILAADSTQLTPTTNIDSEATWADRFRDSDRYTTQVHYTETQHWHYVDLEISTPDLKSACFGEPPLNGALASNGPAQDCVVDKINEFNAELQDPATTDAERLYALQFILHFVGDVHQPLHASDDHDRGGNDEKVKAVPPLPKGTGKSSGELHGFWDTQFVALQGRRAATVAQKLIAKITPSQRAKWSAGTPADWANESFAVAKVNAYGPLPAPTSPHNYILPQAYVTNAKGVVATQLSKGGVRLAFVLNHALQ